MEGERGTLLRERPRRVRAGDTDVDAELVPGRIIVRRPGLPTGRAVVGALLVALSVVGLFVAYQQAEQAPDTVYAVVIADLPAGQVLRAEHVAMRPMELAPDVAAITLSRVDQVQGAVALEPLQPGQLLQVDDVLLPGGEAAVATPAFEFAVSLDPARSLGGALQVGEQVDLVATFGDELDCAVVVAEGAVVRRVSGGADELLGPAGEITLTLAVAAPDRLLQSVYAVDEATLTVVRSTRAGDLELTGQFCLSELAPPGGADG
jgi:hypothetical protein